MSDPSRRRRFINFGRNVTFECAEYFEPDSEAAVLEILRTNPKRTIRAIGSLHSWSEAATGDEVVISLHRFKGFRIHDASGAPVAEIGAGCTINEALARLEERNLSLPTVGMVGEQTLCGAVSTSTHGSGRSSLSNYVAAVRLACFSKSGEPEIKNIDTGDALLAARCALGRMGIMLSVTMRCEPASLISERAERHDAIAAAVSRLSDYPLSQFYLLPWSWLWLVHLRRTTRAARSSWLKRSFYHSLRRLTLLWLNLCIYTAVRWLERPALVPWIYRNLLRAAPPNPVVDRSDKVLMMTGPARYIEMEIFVPAPRVEDAAALVESMVKFVARKSPDAPKALISAMQSAGVADAWNDIHGRYVHHYPILFRHVRQDDTLISMAGMGEMYAISFVSVAEDDGFIRFARVVAAVMAAQLDARPHWGKVFPLRHAELMPLLPQLARFRDECRRVDPSGRFRNAFTRDIFGF
jgi:FAD/FMN-containing dehydrogenase